MKRLLKYAAALAAVLIVAFVALSFLFDANRFRPLLEQQLSQAVGRTVTIGDLHLALFSGGVSATELKVSEDPAFGTQPFVTAQSLNIGVDLGALIFSRVLHVRSFTVDGAEVRLIQSEIGGWNFSNLGGAAAKAGAKEGDAKAGQAKAQPIADSTAAPSSSSSGLDLSVNLFRISNSTVHLNMGKTPHEFRNFNFELRDFAPAATMPFTLTADGAGAGNLKVTGQAGPIASPDAAMTPFQSQVEIKGLDLAAGGFVEPASGVAGLLTLRGEANSNGKTASVTGAVTMDQLKLAKGGKPAEHPVAINLALAHDLEARRGNIARSDLKLGSAVAAIRGSYNLAGAAPTIAMVVQGAKMPLPELLAFLPALDVQLPAGASVDGGTVDLQLDARGTLAALQTAGSLKVNNATLNYDLGSKLKIIAQLADLPTGSATKVEQLGADFQMNPGGTAVRNILFNAPTIGQMTGEGTVSPQHALDFQMKAVVRTGGAVATALRQRGDTTTVPFFIRGTSSDPKFSADVKSLANEKLQQAIRNPEGAAKNAVDTAKGILNLFRKAPKGDAPAGQQPQGQQ